MSTKPRKQNTKSALMSSGDSEEKLLRSVALQNARAILLARERSEQELIQAKEALELSTEELAHSLALMRATLESTTDGILITDEHGRVTGFNERFLTLWRLPRECIENKNHRDLLEMNRHHFSNPNEILSRIETIYASSLPESFDVLKLIDARVFERFSKIQIVEDRNAGRVWSFRDITERQRQEAVQEGQRRVLQLMAEDASLASVLNALLVSLELESDGNMRGSILLLDPDRIHLRHGAAPSLPTAYNQAIDGAEIGPRTGSCGTAAFLKAPVHVIDIAIDPLWADYRELALAHGLRACWSSPIFSSDGEVLGTFAMYYTEPRRPNEKDLKVVERATRTVSLALERKRAAGALRESSERFQSMADNIAQLAWMMDAAGSIFWYNQRWFDYSGTSLEEMQGWGWQKIHHPDHVERVTEKFRRHIESGETWEDTFPLRGRDGTFRWFLSRAVPAHDNQGKVARWFGTNTDITEQREAREALQKKQERLNAALTASSTGTFVWHIQTNSFEGDRNLERLFGLEPAKTVRQLADYVGMVHPEDRANFISRCERSAKQGDDFEMEFRVTRPDGSERWLYDQGKTFLDGERKPFYMAGACVDITERKLTEIALSETRDTLANSNLELEKRVMERTAELTQTNSQLETLVYSIAHDLRSPLRSMQAFSTMLLNDYASQLEPAAQEYAKRIVHSAERMDALVLDLLNYGRTARSDMALEPVDVDAAWRGALAQHEKEIQTKNARIEMTASGLKVFAHETTLKQILANLLGNALKFVSVGETPQILFRAEAQGNLVRLWVEDHGIGIAPEYHERIFRVFEQLDGRAYPGTGIGLSIVRKGIERMGGKVGLESTPGHGTRFWIEVPKA